MLRIYYFLIFFIFALTACVNTDNKSNTSESDNEDETEVVLSEEEQRVEKGRILFVSTCKLCHGADGTLSLNGAKDLSKSPLSKEEKILVIKNGRKTMAAYKNVFSEDEINLLADFVESLKNK